MHANSLSFTTLALFAANIGISSATFTYNSCQSASAITASSFTSSANSTYMSVGLCGEQCTNYSFLAVYDTQCFCGTSLPSTSSATKDDCDTPCPGYPTDTCGGGSGASEYFSLYSNPEVSAANTTSTASFSISTVTATPISTATSLSTATGVVGNSSISSTTSSKTSSAASTTPSVVQVSGADAAFGIGGAGVLAAIAGLLAVL